MSHSEALSRLTIEDRRTSDMIRWALRRAIDKFERDWTDDASYVRDMIHASPRAAWLFSRISALGKFRRGLPTEAWCAAGITAVRHEDCGNSASRWRSVPVSVLRFCAPCSPTT